MQELLSPRVARRCEKDSPPKDTRAGRANFPANSLCIRHLTIGVRPLRVHTGRTESKASGGARWH